MIKSQGLATITTNIKIDRKTSSLNNINDVEICCQNLRIHIHGKN